MFPKTLHPPHRPGHSSVPLFRDVLVWSGNPISAGAGYRAESGAGPEADVVPLADKIMRKGLESGRAVPS